jgi:hypothetical protein
MKKKFIAIALINVSVMGCATLSKEECLQGDWRGIGYRDAINGYGLTWLEQHQKACADYDVTPDLNAYRTGHDEGLVIYCTPENGFKVGQAGRYYQDGICPAHLANAFLDQYLIGVNSSSGIFYDQHLAGLYSKLSLIENNIGSNLSSIENTINELERTTDKEKMKLLHSRLSTYRLSYNKLIQEHQNITNLYHQTQQEKKQYLLKNLGRGETTSIRIFSKT